MASKRHQDTPTSSSPAVKRTRTASTVSKQTLDTPNNPSPSVKRTRTASNVSKHTPEKPNSPSPSIKPIPTTTTSLVKRSHRANFSRLCTLHNWTPSPSVRSKLACLLHLSGPRLHASELLPLAFVQHYPFIWLKDFLLLGYNSANESIWYKAFPSSRGIARGRYYNSAEENILGKHTVKTYWQSWSDVFDIENRGLDRSHEYFTGVYLILQKFPNLRYKCDYRREFARDPQSARRVTGIAEFPFNDDHAFMRGGIVESNGEEKSEAEETLDPLTDSEYSDTDESTVVIKQERTDSLDKDLPSNTIPQHNPHTNPRKTTSASSSHQSTRTANTQATSHNPPSSLTSLTPTSTPPPIKSPYFTHKKKQQPVLSLPHHTSQNHREFTLRIPIEDPRWSTTKFEFAVVKAVQTVPEMPGTDFGRG